MSISGANESGDLLEVLAIIDEAHAKSRGYADYWEWRLDRQLAERGAAQVLSNYLARCGEDATGTITSVDADPPDVLITTPLGRRIGIEVTDLVDPAAVKRHSHRKKNGLKAAYDWAGWTVEAVAAKLAQLVEAKDAKLAKRVGEYDELIVAITTDEPMIDEAMARAAVARCHPRAKLVTRAFLLVSYLPTVDKDVFPDGCPILEIDTSRCGARP